MTRVRYYCTILNIVLLLQLTIRTSMVVLDNNLEFNNFLQQFPFFSFKLMQMETVRTFYNIYCQMFSTTIPQYFTISTVACYLPQSPSTYSLVKSPIFPNVSEDQTRQHHSLSSNQHIHHVTLCQNGRSKLVYQSEQDTVNQGVDTVDRINI